jgi:hypothetical protein
MEPEAAEADDERSDWSALQGRGSSLPLLSACAPGANNFAGNTIGPSGGFSGPAMQDNPSANERRLAITHPA